MFRLTMSTMVFATLAVTGCASDPGQTISGRVKAGSFPEPITHVRAIGNTSTVQAPVAADGSFAITLPAGERYRIEMVSAVRRSDLLFPRPTTGTLDTSFYIASSGAAFDLGGVQYVKDPATSTTIFDTGGGGSEDGSGGTEDGTGGGQDTGTGGGQDTGTGGGEDGGASCGSTSSEPDGAGVSEDGAVAEHSPDAALNCDGRGDGDSGGGGQDTGSGGQDTGGGGGG
jgi:hypothetical protein